VTLTRGPINAFFAVFQCIYLISVIHSFIFCYHILIFIHRKFGSKTKTQQRKHKYKQDTIQNTTIKSITVVDT